MSVADALVHLDDAVQALTTEGWQSATGEPGTWQPLHPLQCCISNDLDRVDRAIGLPGASMFAGLADSVRQALVAVAAAQQALKGTAPPALPPRPKDSA